MKEIEGQSLSGPACDTANSHSLCVARNEPRVSIENDERLVDPAPIDASNSPLEFVDECDELSFGLDPALGQEDLDLSGNISWLASDDEDPFTSLDSPASLCTGSPDDGDEADVSEKLRESGPLLSSSFDDCDVFITDRTSSRPPADAPMDALRASKCGASGIPASVEIPLATPTQVDPKPAVPQLPLQCEGSKAMVSSQGHVVRMMPVWMMPTAQHPQGRMIRMPVHFLPGPAATAMPCVPANKCIAPSLSGSRPESCCLSTQFMAEDVVSFLFSFPVCLLACLRFQDHLYCLSRLIDSTGVGWGLQAFGNPSSDCMCSDSRSVCMPSPGTHPMITCYRFTLKQWLVARLSSKE
jgi:hypothetical protein